MAGQGNSHIVRKLRMMIVCIKCYGRTAVSGISGRESKAGRLVGLAGSYAVIVLADNATILLAVNRIAAFRSHSAIITNIFICCRGIVGRGSAPQS